MSTQGVAIVLSFVGLGLGCGRKAALSPPEEQVAVAPLAPPPPPAEADLARDRMPAGKMASVAVQAPAGTSVLAAVAASQKLIRSGQLVIEVTSYDAAAHEVERIAQAHGGYVADSQSAHTGDDKRRGTLTIRVRAEQFGAAFTALKALGKVRSEGVTTQDITKAYADLETRLRVKREAESRLRDILRNRTARLSDVIEAEQALSRVIEEIEQAEGERRFYDQQVALSTVAVTLQEPQAVIREGALEPILEALRDALHVLSRSVAAIVYLLVFLTPWVFLAGVLFWMIRKAWSSRKRRMAKPEA